MYRNIVYSIDEDTRVGHIELYTWDKDGRPIRELHKHYSHVTYVVPYETKMKSIYGENLRTKYFDNVFDQRRFIKQHPDMQILEAQRPENEFLRSHFLKTFEDPDFQRHPFRIQFMDIEVAVGHSKYKDDHQIKVRKKK